MKTFNFDKPMTSEALNESLHKQFNVKINFEKYSRDQLEDYRNLLRTKVHQIESQANFNDLLTNETYQRDKFVLGVINTRIKEMLGEAKLAEPAFSKSQQQAAGIALAAKRSGKKPKAGTASAAMAKMPTKELEKFAKTKHKGLPKHKKSDESVEEGKTMKKTTKAKPDFLDLDKDGNKKEPMKKAAKDAKGTNEMFSYKDDKSKPKDVLGRRKPGEIAKYPDDYKAMKANPQMSKHYPLGKPKGKLPEAAKPDYIDLDKDGNKKEPMKKAAADAKKCCCKTKGESMCPVHTKKNVKEARQSAAERAHHHACEYAKHHKTGNLEMAMHHRDACEECGGMIQHGPMGECWHMHVGKNTGLPYPVDETMNYAMENVQRFKRNNVIIAESIARLLLEDEEGKAKAITSAMDMVSDFTSWMQRVGNYQTKTMIETSDSIRANFGAHEAETFKASVSPALETTLNALTQSREQINQAVAVLAGEAPAQEPMGQEPEMGDDMGGMNAPMPAEDEFAASDAASGGMETAGRMKRESIERGNRLMKILGA